MVDVVGFLSDGKVPCKFDTDVNAPALAEFMVSGRRGERARNRTKAPHELVQQFFGFSREL